MRPWFQKGTWGHTTSSPPPKLSWRALLPEQWVCRRGRQSRCALPPSQGVQRECTRLCYLQTARETQVLGNKAFHLESIEGVSQPVRLLQWRHTETPFFFLRTCSLSHLEEHPYQFMHSVWALVCLYLTLPHQESQCMGDESHISEYLQSFRENRL